MQSDKSVKTEGVQHFWKHRVQGDGNQWASNDLQGFGTAKAYMSGLRLGKADNICILLVQDLQDCKIVCYELRQVKSLHVPALPQSGDETTSHAATFLLAVDKGDVQLNAAGKVKRCYGLFVNPGPQSNTGIVLRSCWQMYNGGYRTRSLDDALWQVLRTPLEQVLKPFFTDGVSLAPEPKLPQPNPNNENDLTRQVLELLAPAHVAALYYMHARQLMPQTMAPSVAHQVIINCGFSLAELSKDNVKDLCGKLGLSNVGSMLVLQQRVREELLKRLQKKKKKSCQRRDPPMTQQPKSFAVAFQCAQSESWIA
eukprot:m.109792 g.109792  ORF g.109792 m.109792 type:complete len:312 (+) comp22696_c0_seq6:21-956(+)